MWGNRPYHPCDETAKDVVEDKIINSDLPLKHEEWYRQADILNTMPTSMNHGTRKSKVSKAVSKGDLQTNGKKGSECLIQGASAIAWLDTFKSTNRIPDTNPDISSNDNN